MEYLGGGGTEGKQEIPRNSRSAARIARLLPRPGQEQYSDNKQKHRSDLITLSQIHEPKFKIPG